MDPSKMLQDKRDEILRIAAAHGAQNVRVFGSVSRGEAGAKSDVDLLVKLEPGRIFSISSRSNKTLRTC
jgi:uncharacterized protein